MPDDVDTLFPADQKQDVDSLFPADVEKQRTRESLGASPVADLIFGDTTVNPVARVLDAFGQGAKQNWGAGGEAISDDTAKLLTKAGVFNDYQKGQHNIIKAGNEVLMRGAANFLYTGLVRAPSAIFGGAQAAAAQIGEEVGQKELGREVAALPEAFPLFGAEVGGVGVPRPPTLPAPIAEARSLGVIGEGEAGWKGTVLPKPEIAPVADAEAVKTTAEAQPQLPGQPETPTAPTAAPEPTPQPAPDVHTVARQIAPEVFNEYDALTTRRDTFRRWIDDLREVRDQNAQANAPHADEIADLQARLQDTTPRLAKKYQARLEPLLAERDAYVADQTSRDSSDMAKIRERLMETDYRMRDLAPDVAKAYRAAQERMPQTAEVPAVEEAQAQEPAESAPATVESPPEIGGEMSTPAQSVEQQAERTPEAQAAPEQPKLPLTPSPSIAADVQSKLVAAGRPADEAQAAAALVQAYWETRAARFKGAKGTAQEMYAAEAPEIKAGKEKTQQPRSDQDLWNSFLADRQEVNKRARVATGFNDFRTRQGNAPLRGESSQAWTAGNIVDVGFVKDLLIASANDDGSFTLLAKPDKDGLSQSYNARPHEGLVKENKVNFVDTTKDIAPVPELAQVKQGRIRIRDDGRNTITLLKNADASTLIHETGHDWLDRMLRDAKDEAAPDDLKADADTVLKWLGADSADTLKTRHHEKFARGFETYMMEGRAPSQGLASVFAKFKDWLTTIYRTVSALKAPISDDIRAVFDRLLAENPERPVIAPERGPTLADSHEALAEATPPEQADTVGDKVQTERDTHAAQNLVEDNNARLADTGAEASRSASRGEEPPGDVNAAGPVSGEAEAVGGTGTVGAGGSEAAAEGAGARKEPEPVVATEPIPRSDTHYVDKAGNIRLDTLGTPEDVNKVLRQTADDLAPYDFAITRGRVSDRQVLELADALGMDAAQLGKRKIGEAFNAEQVVAARKLLIQSATNVRDLAAKAADGTEADVMAYVEAADRHRMIQEQVSGITAEAGRALRAFRGMKNASAIGAAVQDVTGKTLYQIRNAARKIANLDTPEQVSKFVNDSQKKGFFDWIQSGFINSLISGPFTHGGYTAAGQIYGLFRAVGEAGTSAAVGKLRELTGWGPQEYASINEVPHQLYGMMRGGRNGIKAAWKAIKSNEVVLPEEVTRQQDLPLQTGQSVNPRETIPNPTIGGVRVPIGTVLESPGRLVAALHSFNWTTFYSQSISGQAFRIAMREKLEGDAFSSRIAELTQNPTDEMIEEASKDANGGALMQRPAYDSLMGSVSRLTNWGVQVPDLPLPGGRSLPMGTLRPLKYIDPFVQIQANIQKTAFGRGTPLALFSKEVRDDLLMKNGGVAFDRTAGRILAGTGFMMAAGALAAEGLLNHSGPSDPKQSREWQRIHGMPHGLTIGNLSYDVLRLGNLGMQMSVAADLYHVAAEIGKEDSTKVASDLAYAFAQNIVDESSMRGPAELMQAIDEHDRYGAAWVRNFVSSAIPFSVGLSQSARMVDPYSRQARTTMDAIKAKIPFVSESLMPRRDVWGEPVPNRGWLGTYNQRIINDPVDNALYNLGIYPSLPERRIRGVQLTDQQYDDYSRISGRTAKMRLNAIVGMPGFAQMPQEAKIDLVEKTLKSARDSAQSLVMMQNPSIFMQATDAKRAKARGATVH